MSIKNKEIRRLKKDIERFKLQRDSYRHELDRTRKFIDTYINDTKKGSKAFEKERINLLENLLKFFVISESEFSIDRLSECVRDIDRTIIEKLQNWEITYDYFPATDEYMINCKKNENENGNENVGHIHAFKLRKKRDNIKIFIKED